MRVGMVGLGKMGAGMAERLLRDGHEVVVHDADAAILERFCGTVGGRAAASLAELVASLEPPRVVWVMVPAGVTTGAVLAALADRMEPGDVLVDGGNSMFRDTMRRAADLEARGVRLVDVGTSGGVWGLEAGYCLMIGGAPDAVARCDPLFRSLAPPDGYAHLGLSGAGHFVKMIHNGIEYGLLQAYAEGFEILHASEFELDLGRVAGLWNQGSVIRSWLLELLERAYAAEGPRLEAIQGWIADSGEGRWTVETALDLDVPAPVITLSLLTRFRSRQPDSYSARVVAALRGQFGGHAVPTTASVGPRDAPSGHPPPRHPRESGDPGGAPAGASGDPPSGVQPSGNPPGGDPPPRHPRESGDPGDAPPGASGVPPGGVPRSGNPPSGDPPPRHPRESGDPGAAPSGHPPRRHPRVRDDDAGAA